MITEKPVSISVKSRMMYRRRIAGRAMITGYPGISHIINDSGSAVMTAGAREVICEFENGEIVR